VIFSNGEICQLNLKMRVCPSTIIAISFLFRHSSDGFEDLHFESLYAKYHPEIEQQLEARKVRLE
jgi:hypothetical protein